MEVPGGSVYSPVGGAIAASSAALGRGFATSGEDSSIVMFDLATFKPLGQVIAIGRPSEPMPELGAVRFYVSDDEWQAVVLNWIAKAELVVLRQMMGTQIYKEIARALGCSPGTVRTQAATVCQKLGVDSRQQAVLKALRLGILHLDEA